MNMNWDAAFAACKSYDDTEVSAALQTAVDAAGGLDWVTPGMRVALKLNLVSAMKPEQAATVHPAVVCALVRMLTARGRSARCGTQRGLFCLYRLVPGGFAGALVHHDRLSAAGRRNHRCLQTQNARHDGHDERREKLFWHHSRHDEAGISL